MKTLILKGHKVIEGHVEGEALVTKEPISFMGSINPKTGIVIERGHDIEGQCLKGKIFRICSSNWSNNFRFTYG